MRALVVSCLLACCLPAQTAPAAVLGGIVGVASGKAAADGRALLWQSHDAQARDVVVQPFADGKGPYVAMCAAGDAAAVRGGANAAGFCIAWAARGEGAGGAAVLARKALQSCTSLAEFEELARAVPQTERAAVFGVVDAHGGAALFDGTGAEVARSDAEKAPDGVLVHVVARADGGAARRERALAVLASPQAKPLRRSFLLQQFVRDVRVPASAARGAPGRQDVREALHTDTTVGGFVFEAVAPKENPALTTMWALLGPPLLTVAVPCWPAAEGAAPEVCGYPKSALCDASLRVWAQLFENAPLAGDSGPSIDWLLTARLAPVRRDVLFGEADLLARVDEQLGRWRQQDGPIAASAQRAFHGKMAKLALERVGDLGETTPSGGK